MTPDNQDAVVSAPDQLKFALDNLYDAFLEQCAPLKNELEDKIKALHEDLAKFRKPFDDLFADATAEKRAALMPGIEKIENEHRYACHKVAVEAHRRIDKLEKKRIRTLSPIQAKWKEQTTVEQMMLDESVDSHIKELNAAIEALSESFNVANKPAHDLYLARAKELEQIHTPPAEPDAVEPAVE